MARVMALTLCRQCAPLLGPTLRAGSRRLHATPGVYDGAESGGGGPATVSGVTFLKDAKDPALLSDSEYPEWLWKIAEERPQAQSHRQRLYWQSKRKASLKQQNLSQQGV